MASAGGIDAVEGVLMVATGFEGEAKRQRLSNVWGHHMAVLVG